MVLQDLMSMTVWRVAELKEELEARGEARRGNKAVGRGFGACCTLQLCAPTC